MSSLLGVPIFTQGKLVGDLYLTEKIGASEFSEEDEWLVQLLATHAATALTNAHLHAENLRAFQNLRALQNAVQRITSHLDLRSMGEELLRYAVEVTGSKLAWLGLLDAERTTLSPVTIKGSGVDEQIRRLLTIDLTNPELAGGPSGRAVIEGNPQVLSDISTDPSLRAWREFADRYNVCSAVSVPLIYQGSALGVLSLYSGDEGAFDDVDLAPLPAGDTREGALAGPPQGDPGHQPLRAPGRGDPPDRGVGGGPARGRRRGGLPA
jgi:GAF domain-containing protein